MSSFNKHFCLNEIDAIEYIKEKLPDYFDNNVLKCHEIGDGNINYVYRIEDEKNKKSIIIKQADIYFRNSKDPVDVDRNRIEAKILKIENKLCPNYVPYVYLYDSIMNCIVMEDIKGHDNMRYCLLKHEIFSKFAEQISTFLVETLIATTDLIINPAQKKLWDKEFINVDMCEITERLVLEEPYKNKNNSNIVLKENTEFVNKEIYQDKNLCFEVSKLKYLFQSKSQSLIHGDLHSGSIFINQDSIKILDPEFAFYGPAGYDISNVIAHLIFAYSNANATMKNITKKCEFQNWILESIEKIIDLFKEKSKNKIHKEINDVMFNSDEFIDYYINNILMDCSGFAGLELIRRTVGSSKVKDLTSIDILEDRILAERFCILVGKKLILNRSFNLNGNDYINIIKELDGKLYV